MSATILDGKATAATIKSELTERVRVLKEQGVQIGLGTVLVGDDPGSHAYVRGKHRDCAKVGIESIDVRLPATATQAEVEAEVVRLNADPGCTGFLVQTPLPKHLDINRVLELLDPVKDADGLHPRSLGWLALNQPAPLPATPRATLELLRRYGIELAGAEVCVIGRGIVAGRTLGLLLTRKTENATVTLCHTGTKDLAAHTKRADIVIAAAGAPGLITPEMIRPGAAVVDVGITRTDSGLVGDVDPATAEVAGWLSPVPGGVGPLTRAMLLTTVVEIAERRASLGV